MIIHFGSLYFTKPGFKDGTFKFLKIVRWYLLSGAVTVGMAYAANYNIVDKDNAYIFGTMMIINAGLAGISKWLNTNKPEGIIEIKTPFVDGEVIG